MRNATEGDNHANAGFPWIDIRRADELPGGGGQDKFRIKIFGPGGGVYDNHIGMPDDGEPATVIVTGNIAIHR